MIWLVRLGLVVTFGVSEEYIEQLFLCLAYVKFIAILTFCFNVFNVGLNVGFWCNCYFVMNIIVCVIRYLRITILKYFSKLLSYIFLISKGVNII